MLPCLCCCFDGFVFSWPICFFFLFCLFFNFFATSTCTFSGISAFLVAILFSGIFFSLCLFLFFFFLVGDWLVLSFSSLICADFTSDFSGVCWTFWLPGLSALLLLPLPFFFLLAKCFFWFPVLMSLFSSDFFSLSTSLFCFFLFFCFFFEFLPSVGGVTGPGALKNKQLSL